jgi:hypothetical protein
MDRRHANHFISWAELKTLIFQQILLLGHAYIMLGIWKNLFLNETLDLLESSILKSSKKIKVIFCLSQLFVSSRSWSKPPIFILEFTYLEAIAFWPNLRQCKANTFQSSKKPYSPQSLSYCNFLQSSTNFSQDQIVAIAITDRVPEQALAVPGWSEV